MFELQTIWKIGKPYLKRWRIVGTLNPDNGSGFGEFGQKITSKLPFALRVHKFFQKDEDLCLHNHPWKWAVSFIFWGGYTELKYNIETGIMYEVKHIAPAINIIRHHDYHMVTSLIGKPMSLFLCGPRTYKDNWGFLVNNVHIPWKKFLGIEDGSEEKDKSSSRYN
jgi:hypothetical protein